MSDTLIKATNITLTYPDTSSGFRNLFKRKSLAKKALKNIDLELKRGERIALIGRNGSGKSTLLRVLSGIYPPDQGQVVINSDRVQSIFNMGIGTRPDLSARQNVELLGLIAGKSRDEMDDLIPDVIEFSELAEVFDQPMRTYSRGMAMRLAFAVATSLNPEVLLLDEWIGAGDKEFRNKASKRLSAMVEGAGAFILASHNSSIVSQYCTKAIWLDRGDIKMQGDVEEVLEAYDETFAEKMERKRERQAKRRAERAAKANKSE